MNKNKIAILGSTGSIGTQTLEVIRENPGTFEVFALAADTKIDLLARQIIEFRPEVVRVRDSSYASQLKLLLSEISSCPQILVGEEGLLEIVSLKAVETVMCAITGFAAFPSLVEAIKNGKAIALANKESLIVGGRALKGLLEKHPVKFIPVDSEHNSIFQCLRARPEEEPRRVLITASGGPFLFHTKEELRDVTVEEAIKHPRWEMGAKISVDSATLMNKGLEVIEALELFSFPPEKMEVVIHPQHIIHAIVEYEDAAAFALMYEPDMKVPITHALFSCATDAKFYKSPKGMINREMLDFTKLSKLDFLPPDYDRFPCLRLAFEAFSIGGDGTLILNWANEVAVKAFLQRQISFVQIPVIIEQSLQHAKPDKDLSTLDDIYKVQKETEALVAEVLSNNV